MFGLYYAVIGLISGVICSLIANKKSRNQKDWFTLGQVLPLVSIAILSMLPEKNEKESTDSYFQHKGNCDTLLKPIS